VIPVASRMLLPPCIGSFSIGSFSIGTGHSGVRQNGNRPSRHQSDVYAVRCRATTNTALVPPKANELLITRLICSPQRALLGM